ncbi:TPA: isochorismatase family protein [Providencia rettgeri]
MSKALLLIDMQRFVENRIEQGIHYYPQDAISNMRYVLNRFRMNNEMIIHIIHQTPMEGSLLHENSPYYTLMDDFKNASSEVLFVKQTSSAFASTQLKQYLENNAITELVVIGAVAGFCVNSTIRHGADLGIIMTVVSDAVISFDLPDLQCEAKNIHDVTIGLLQSDFAKISLASSY